MDAAAPLDFLIIGAGFGGLGMGIRLRQAGIDRFLILERSTDLGGVWRDNTYPGAACDVPSHLYSFSFEPNPRWSNVYSPQGEILQYLRHCAKKYGLEPRLRLRSEVVEARYEEATALWQVRLQDGLQYTTRVLVTALGQLSRPVISPQPGLADFQGVAFHSACWPAATDLTDKRIAVIGTGASAVQFVPAIAPVAARLSVFQRSPNYLLPQPQRAYRRWEQALFSALPMSARLYRASIFLRHEVLALAFGRLQPLFRGLGQWPCRRLLRRQVPSASLRAALTPGYALGCKRILLSNDYLTTLTRDNVALVTSPIRRILPNGIETADGAQHLVDIIIHGTGFAATDFLAHLPVRGVGGQSLQELWRDGAAASLGLSVPGFPNFFMLYGPNTNLGHNSVLQMLESQFAHVLRCWRAMERAGAAAIEVDEGAFVRERERVRAALAHTVWARCRNWYTDSRGHQPTNWPGFTLSYRWRTQYAPLRAYHYLHTLPALPQDQAGLSAVAIAPPQDWRERWQAAQFRLGLRLLFRAFMGPPWSVHTQRRVLQILSRIGPPTRGVTQQRVSLEGVPTEQLVPTKTIAGALLYLHGGGFCLGSPGTHRAFTSRLARATGLVTWVPDYRLAPEHPFPAALEDALLAYRALRQVYAAEHIVVAGDSAGGSLALALALHLRAAGEPLPAALLLLSPVVDTRWTGDTLHTRAAVDPMLRQRWVEQAVGWYGCPPTAMVHRPLEVDLRGLPPLLVQVGDQEILLSDSLRLAAHASRCDVPCRLEVYLERWHVFQLLPLKSSRYALGTLARFAREAVASGEPHAQDGSDGSARV